ncbi:unnamed protein product [Pleuronectes platessa]|uniref:Uncharacterized protein n=1 Tax=Pleuronectes platessa TaxID=8262 RepID=A0A9N7U1U8_PLEPL|nr:unnamed protein product [Pleuronectes platessa]
MDGLVWLVGLVGLGGEGVDALQSGALSMGYFLKHLPRSYPSLEGQGIRRGGHVVTPAELFIAAFCRYTITEIERLHWAGLRQERCVYVQPGKVPVTSFNRVRSCR